MIEATKEILEVLRPNLIEDHSKFLKNNILKYVCNCFHICYLYVGNNILLRKIGNIYWRETLNTQDINKYLEDSEYNPTKCGYWKWKNCKLAYRGELTDLEKILPKNVTMSIS